MVSANIVANNILKRAFEENIPVTPMKLQKLLYLVFKQYLKDTGQILFSESFMAWRYGPAVESVYDEFKTYHADPITEYSKDSKGNSYIVDENACPPFLLAIDTIWERYKTYNGIQLSNLTHKPGTAWDKAKKSQSMSLDIDDIGNEPDLDNF